MKEDFFINLIKETLPESRQFIGDDTAFIEDKGLVLTQDTLIQDIHFRLETISPYDLGIKSIAVNLSDIAAAGAEGGYCLISLSLPEHISEEFIKSFYQGVRKISETYGVKVVGGDLTRAEKITVSVAVVGFSNGITPAKRSNAKADDYVIVTGHFGSSKAGLQLLESTLSSDNIVGNTDEITVKTFISTHINPVPRLKEGRALVKLCKRPPALMDTSDGLADALYKISVSSRVSMDINFADIPYEKALQDVALKFFAKVQDWILYGGEDYELVGTVSKQDLEIIKQNKLPFKVIGRVINIHEKPAVYVNKDSKVIEINEKSFEGKVYSHFS